MRLLLALLLLGSLPAPLAAQCQLCRHDGNDAAIAARKASMPLRVEVDTQLDMGRFAVGASGGEVEIDPLTGARRLRGDVRDLGGFAVTGVVTVSGEPGAEECEAEADQPEQRRQRTPAVGRQPEDQGEHGGGGGDGGNGAVGRQSGTGERLEAEKQPAGDGRGTDRESHMPATALFPPCDRTKQRTDHRLTD